MNHRSKVSVVTWGKSTKWILQQRNREISGNARHSSSSFRYEEGSKGMSLVLEMMKMQSTDLGPSYFPQGSLYTSGP